MLYKAGTWLQPYNARLLGTPSMGSLYALSGPTFRLSFVQCF